MSILFLYSKATIDSIHVKIIRYITSPLFTNHPDAAAPVKLATFPLPTVDLVGVAGEEVPFLATVLDASNARLMRVPETVIAEPCKSVYPATTNCVLELAVNVEPPISIEDSELAVRDTSMGMVPYCPPTVDRDEALPIERETVFDPTSRPAP